MITSTQLVVQLELLIVCKLVVLIIMEATEPLKSLGQVHLFGEGKVNQPVLWKNSDDHKPDSTKLLRFKWGVYVLHFHAFLQHQQPT